MCVALFPGVCVCVRACVHVRAFMHHTGNCRCWFVCIGGSACSHIKESFLKATSFSKVSSLNPLSSAKTITTHICNSHKRIKKKKDIFACLFHYVYIHVQPWDGLKIRFKIYRGNVSRPKMLLLTNQRCTNSSFCFSSSASALFFSPSQSVWY